MSEGECICFCSVCKGKFKASKGQIVKHFKKYDNKKVCKCMHRPIRWITPLKYKNVSLIRQIYTLKAWCFPIFLVQSPKLNSYLRKRYSLKCWPLRFTYKAPLLIRPVPYKWGIMVYIILFKCSFAACGTKKIQIKVREKYKCVENQNKSKKYTTVSRQILMKNIQAYM